MRERLTGIGLAEDSGEKLARLWGGVAGAGSAGEGDDGRGAGRLARRWGIGLGEGEKGARVVSASGALLVLTC